MLDSQLEVTDKIGYFLLKKGIIDDDILEKALEIKQDDQSKKKRNLAQILVHELKFDHDTIFKEVAVLYAFKELDIQVDELPPERIEEIKYPVHNNCAVYLFNRSFHHAIRRNLVFRYKRVIRVIH